jgi:3-oxoacyl-[acyl-carrier-protein] synthase II
MCEDVMPEGMTAKDLRRRDRVTVFALEAADQAWRDSGLDIEDEDPGRCGVIVGTGIGGLQTIQDELDVFFHKGPRRVSPMMLPKVLVNMASGEVGIRLGLRGPNKSVVTACAAATQSIGTALHMIRHGYADVMVAGGSEAGVVPFGVAGFCALRALSTKRNDEPEKASRPFDKDRDGFIIAEGAGLLVLEEEEHAKKRGAEIICEAAGIGENCDAYHVTAPQPDGSGGAEVIRLALNDARVDADDVDYYNAHGTSTPLNDVSEAKALVSVFGAETMPLVSSTKSMTGHLLGAAGAIEGIAAVQAIRTQVVPPNINYETPDPDITVNLVANEAREADVAIAVSNSLGFGGHNASAVFRAYG